MTNAELIPATGAAYANACPECGAEPGAACVNHLGATLSYLGPSFTSSYVHRVRLLAEHECRNCGEEIEEDQEGWLCRTCDAAESVDSMCVDNHCSECGEFEAECTCNDAAGFQGAHNIQQRKEGDK